MRKSASVRLRDKITLVPSLRMNRQRLQQVLAAGASRHLAVIGDVMLDRFIYGRVSRISPEAPVPVVEVVQETSHPGGAANVARNLPPFCHKVSLCGVTGQDSGGAELRALLHAEGVDASLLVECPDYLTTVKTRVIARQQQVVRVDREKKTPPAGDTLGIVLDRLREIGPQLDAIIIEDYGKGFITQELVDELRSSFAHTKTLLLVDPNPTNPLDWRGLTAVKPNRLEAFAAAGIPVSEPAPHPLEDAALLRVGEKLLKKWEPRCLLITLGEQGMMLFQPERDPFHIPTLAREVYDVSGAGDTAIALFALTLATGATAEEAAEISNLASGVVVGKLGTATLFPQELLDLANFR